jgi:hypothetical protein
MRAKYTYSIWVVTVAEMKNTSDSITLSQDHGSDAIHAKDLAVCHSVHTLPQLLHLELKTPFLHA